MATLLDKNDRAIRAFIFDAVKGFNAGTGITIRNNGQKREVVIKGIAVGIVDVDSLTGAEYPPGSGNYDINVMVRVKFPDATQPNQGANDNRVSLGALAEAVSNRLHLTGGEQDYAATAAGISAAGNALAVDQSGGLDDVQVQIAADNADMAAYSCLEVRHTNITGGKNGQDAGDLNFYELCNFKCSVAGYGGYWN